MCEAAAKSLVQSVPRAAQQQGQTAAVWRVNRLDEFGFG
jgi:hypothetical protein